MFAVHLGQRSCQSQSYHLLKKAEELYLPDYLKADCLQEASAVVEGCFVSEFVAAKEVEKVVKKEEDYALEGLAFYQILLTYCSFV